MTCGAALYFDPETDAAIRRLWRLIAEAGLPSNMLSQGYPPHLTILVCEDFELDGAREPLADFVSRQPPIDLDFHSLGVFNTSDGVIYLAPVVTQPMLAFHAALWQLMEPRARSPKALYRPGNWVPHITVAVETPPDQIGAVVETLMRAQLPRVGKLTSLFMADFPSESPVFEELFAQQLGSRLAG